MKRFSLLSLLAFFCFASFAQSNKEDVEMIQAIYGKEKKAIVEAERAKQRALGGGT